MWVWLVALIICIAGWVAIRALDVWWSYQDRQRAAGEI